MVPLWGAGAEAMAAGRGIAEERSYGGRAKAALAALAWGWGGRECVVRGPGVLSNQGGQEAARRCRRWIWRHRSWYGLAERGRGLVEV